MYYRRALVCNEDKDKNSKEIKDDFDDVRQPLPCNVAMAVICYYVCIRRNCQWQVLLDCGTEGIRDGKMDDYEKRR